MITGLRVDSILRKSYSLSIQLLLTPRARLVFAQLPDNWVYVSNRKPNLGYTYNQWWARSFLFLIAARIAAPKTMTSSGRHYPPMSVCIYSGCRKLHTPKLLMHLLSQKSCTPLSSLNCSQIPTSLSQGSDDQGPMVQQIVFSTTLTNPASSSRCLMKGPTWNAMPEASPESSITFPQVLKGWSGPRVS